MFGRARVFTGQTVPGVLVPTEAVQYHEHHPYVFVRQEPDLFALRRVAVGVAGADRTEILAGLHPDEAVVASGFLVMSEFLKSRLGAGCVDH
jgi:cobalt-zinc-cadmium efflux system membrane fusion protein